MLDEEKAPLVEGAFSETSKAGCFDTSEIKPPAKIRKRKNATLAPSRKRGLSCYARRYMNHADSSGFTPRPASSMPRLAMTPGQFTASAA